MHLRCEANFHHDSIRLTRTAVEDVPPPWVRIATPDVLTELDMSPIEQLKIDEGELASLCRRYRVLELSVFGSVARGEADDASDVDLLVSFERGAKATLFTLADLQSELAELLRRPVDLVPKEGLKPAIRGEVLAEAQTLYAA